MTDEIKHGGKREGAGRKKSDRELVKHTVYLYADQLPINSELLREYIDMLKNNMHKKSK